VITGRKGLDKLVHKIGVA